LEEQKHKLAQELIDLQKVIEIHLLYLDALIIHSLILCVLRMKLIATVLFQEQEEREEQLREEQQEAVDNDEIRFVLMGHDLHTVIP
jgi:hypothetical protein